MKRTNFPRRGTTREVGGIISANRRKNTVNESKMLMERLTCNVNPNYAIRKVVAHETMIYKSKILMRETGVICNVIVADGKKEISFTRRISFLQS